LRSLSLVLLLAAGTPEWVERSNENAKILLETMAKTSPESAARQGIESVDREILDLKPGYVERNRKLLEEAGAKLGSGWRRRGTQGCGRTWRSWCARRIWG